ncbi:unnamed protein product [Sphagnum jensenii]|uniref:NADH-cytochrome b5 reductase n=1 Tax=Sphagnum jensenii TaxID=128206 RepID=A0ABP1AJT4_9BRYO
MLQWPLDAAVLQPDKWLKFNLVKKQQMSHNVVKLHFALPTPQSMLGLPIGQHISCMGFDTDGMEVVRPYTPTTIDSDIAFFELVIKVRSQPCSMGSSSRGVNTSLLGAPTYGQMERFRYKPNQVWAFGMLTGGTGITPMYQVAQSILENPEDKTKIHVIYANVTYDDILLKEDLDRFARDYPGQFKVYYVLNQRLIAPDQLMMSR